MTDKFAYWLQYLFLSPDEEAWVSGFHKLLDQWRLEDCQKLLVEAKHHADDRPLWIRRIQYCEGRYFLQVGEWERAESYYRDALASLDNEDVTETYHISADLGLIHRLRGDMKDALHNHQLCLSLATQNQWTDAAAESHVQLGLDYEITGELRRAEQHHLEAERLYQQIGDKPQIAVTRKSLALILIRLQQFARAKELLRQVLPVLEIGHEPLHVAQAYGNLGNIAVHEGAYAQAKRDYAQALERFQALGALLEICGILNNLAGIAYYEENFDEARIYYEESLTQARDLGSLSDERNTLANLALVYLSQNDYEAAAQICRKALHISRRLGDRRMVLQLLWRLWRLWLILFLKRLT